MSKCRNISDSSFSLKFINIKFAWDGIVFGDVNTRLQLKLRPVDMLPHLHLSKNVYSPQTVQILPWEGLQSLYFCLKANFPQSCHEVFFFVCGWDGEELYLNGFKIIFYLFALSFRIVLILTPNEHYSPVKGFHVDYCISWTPNELLFT